MTNITRNPPPSNRQLLILLGMFVGFILGVIWLVVWFANSLVWLVPANVEQLLGALVVPAYERLAQPTPAQDTLNQMLNRLETNLPPQPQKRDYQVLYVPNSTVNALAIPGDRIIIYSGLVEQVESENELMMILGHELGHFANRDHLRSLGRDLFFQVAIASIIGDASWVTSSAGSLVAALSKAQYSRSQERQADEFGLTLLQQTYGHVAGATDFFARLSQQKGVDLAFLSTHPAPGKRVAELKRLIEQRNYQSGERSPLAKTLLGVRSQKSGARRREMGRWGDGGAQGTGGAGGEISS